MLIVVDVTDLNDAIGPVGIEEHEVGVPLGKPFQARGRGALGIELEDLVKQALRRVHGSACLAFEEKARVIAMAVV